MSVCKKVNLKLERILANFYFFSLTFLYENTNQEHNLLPDRVFGPFTYAYCENLMSGFFAFVLNLSEPGNILDQC